MIDQTIKRAIVITLLVVFTAKFASTIYDRWMGDTQTQMIENQAAFEDDQRGIAREQGQAEMQFIRAENCEKVLRNPLCALPKDFRDFTQCLNMLGGGHCDELPGINLCAAVEEIEQCADPFDDQKANGCDRLRVQARCKTKPAPASLEGLWRVRFDDGMWQGD